MVPNLRWFDLGYFESRKYTSKCEFWSLPELAIGGTVLADAGQRPGATAPSPRGPQACTIAPLVSCVVGDFHCILCFHIPSCL